MLLLLREKEKGKKKNARPRLRAPRVPWNVRGGGGEPNEKKKKKLTHPTKKVAVASRGALRAFAADAF